MVLLVVDLLTCVAAQIWKLATAMFTVNVRGEMSCTSSSCLNICLNSNIAAWSSPRKCSRRSLRGAKNPKRTTELHNYVTDLR